jgi:hypothetical protein
VKLLGVLFVSPLWGIVSTQLFFQSWLAAFGVLFAGVGLFTGAVGRKSSLLYIAIGAASVLLFSGLLRGGTALLTFLGFGYSDAENISYWIFSALSLFWLLPQLPSKVRKAWRNLTVTNSLEQDMALQQTTSEVSESAVFPTKA